ncbi:hypothetical protein M9R32_05130 [Paenisporosarcina quisquiliarum]|uniref:Competence protein CoiA n=1 Tax=Paenisporosarcina quisquiliarum TaxID=365346 RepID=A0A9X3LER4_9BACL|nr:hypothetical protein [Paenisporosarcina quisquiliarum]
MYILTAKKDNDKIFTLERQMTREHLVHLRSTSQFACPQCGNPLRLKIGKVVTPHFAHIVLTDCFTSFSERESPTHLIGKQQLAEFFTRIGYNVEVEAFVPKISQRPDLLIRKNKSLYAIEFQCSVIPIEDIEKRNSGYRRIKIPTVWILRSPNNFNTSGVTLIKLSKFEQSFIGMDSSSNPTLITYNPSISQFIYFSHLVHITGTSFISKICTLSIEDQTFAFARVKPLTEIEQKQYWRIYQHKRLKFLTNRIFTSKFGARDKFLNDCYLQRILPEKLPLYIGFPIPGSQVFYHHLTEWQLALICWLSNQQVDLANVNESLIEAFLIEHCRVLDLKLAIDVIQKYCQLLQSINYNFTELVSQQLVSESYLFEHFHRFIVAKR